MSELLTRPTVLAEPRPIAGPAPALDAFTRARVDEAAAAAYAQGLRDGAEAARAEAVAAARRLVGVLEAACAGVVAEVRALRLAQVDADVELAEAIAEAVLGHEPSDGAAVLIQRVRAALGRLDDPELTVHANPGDVPALAPALRAEAGVAVVADPGLPAGEARITGRWARAELTRAAARDTVRAALGPPR
ncbi:MAG TPA: FliH/SctL family protein [Egibacteraceae bacterium]|nr:FliH/SctL family protein [Egibacteraceae bacterium]